MAAPSNEPRRIRHYFARHAGAFTAGLFLLIVTQALSLSVPRLLKGATDALVAMDLARTKETAGYLMLIAVLAALARIGSRIFIFNSGREVELDVRNDLFAKLESLPPSFYRKMPSGQLMSRAVNDLTQVRLLLGPGLLNLTNTALVYAVVVPLLFMKDAELAALTLMALPGLVISGQIFARRMYRYNRDAQEKLGELQNKVQENLGGIMTVRAYRREAAERAWFVRLNDAYVAVNLKLAKLRGVLFPLMGLFGAFGTIVLLYAGGARIIDGRLTVGDFVEFNAYIAALTWPTIALGWMLSLWQRGLASMDRINEIFTVEPSIADGPLSARPGAGNIEIRGLTFRYPDSGPETPPTLQDVTTEMRAGETVVIVGRTGSGKSTLLKAILRLLEVPPGTIFVDGRDITELELDALRGAISYAPQDAFLFSRSISENIAFGRPEASQAEIEGATESAGLAGDLSGFTDGLETMVGERGVTLSGGQRQRAALARALLVSSPILILDDTLAAVDTETERHILRALARHSQGRTTLLVTHRLACAELADRILVLDEGRIVEQGTEAELLALGGLYAEMHARQQLQESLERESPEALNAERGAEAVGVSS